MRRTSTLAMLAIVALFGFGALFTIEDSSATNLPGRYSASETAAKAQERVDFSVRTASWLPLTAPQSFSMVQQLPNGIEAVDVEYVDKSGSYVRITTIDHSIVQISDKYELVETSLADGHTATFLDNGKAQILTWTSGEMSYKVVAGKPDGAYTIGELVKIANGLK